MNKRAIVFGGRGQDGYYMASRLRASNIDTLQVGHAECPVGHASSVDELIRQYRPDYVFHFAAVSSTHYSTLLRNQDAIVNGTVSILSSVKERVPKAKVFLAGSVLQFAGDTIALNSPPSYASAYAAQRNAATAIARFYRSDGLDVYIGYFTRHESPRRAHNHLSQRIVQTIKRMAAGSSENLIVHNPSDRMEWNFAGDFMEAVWLQIHSNVHELIIGSGVAHSITDFVQACFDCTELKMGDRCEAIYSGSPATSFTEPTHLKALGWKPLVDLGGLAQMMVWSEPPPDSDAQS